jgi:hypothetical protein
MAWTARQEAWCKQCRRHSVTELAAHGLAAWSEKFPRLQLHLRRSTPVAILVSEPALQHGKPMAAAGDRRLGRLVRYPQVAGA